MKSQILFIYKNLNYQYGNQLNIYKKVFFVFIILIIISSCSKHEISVESIQSSNSLIVSCDDGIVDNFINLTALSLVEISKTKNFRDLVHYEVAKMFDDDHNVLLKTVGEILVNSNQGSLIEQSLNNTIPRMDSMNVQSSRYVNLSIADIYNQRQSIFQGIQICNNTIHLQIYIPNFTSINLDQDPVIALGHDEDPADCITFGYSLQNNTLSVINIDSAYAANNLVWVISVNNVVNENGVVPEGFFKLKDTLNVLSMDYEYSNDTFLESRTDKDKAVRIHSIQIAKKKYNCWLCGKDPVAVVGYFSDFRFCRPVDNPRGINTDVLFKIGKDDLNTWITIPTDKWRAWIAPHQSPLRKWNEAIEFVMYACSNRSKYSQLFKCDDPNCPIPLPNGMQAEYRSKYEPYLKTTYIGNTGNRPLFYFDILTTFGIGLIDFPSYDSYGHKIRFEGGNSIF